MCIAIGDDFSFPFQASPDVYDFIYMLTQATALLLDPPGLKKSLIINKNPQLDTYLAPNPKCPKRQ
jgi:hypothetical protein